MIIYEIIDEIKKNRIISLVFIFMKKKIHINANKSILYAKKHD